MTVAAVLAGGHVLIEDLPGVGKTSLAKAMAASIGGSVGRVQGTPDLLPADITGFSVFNPASGEWTFRPGPIFHNVVLVDEVNRATPRAQSALLEAMAEGQVTVDGVVRPLPEAFCVLATQNPLSDAGTFPLSAGQRDRFSVVVSLGLPAREAERAVVLGQGGTAALAQLQTVAGPEQLAARRAELEGLHAADAGHRLRARHRRRRPPPPEVHSRHQPPRQPAAVPGRPGARRRSTVGATSCPRTSRRPRRPCCPTASTCAAGAASRPDAGWSTRSSPASPRRCREQRRRRAACRGGAGRAARGCSSGCIPPAWRCWPDCCWPPGCPP